MRKSVIVVLPLVLLGGMFANGSAHAQCAPSDKIYIDPRLVPGRLIIAPQDMRNILLSRTIPWETKNYYLQQYQQRGQPIEVPYGTGKVLVHPTNPCIQQ